VNLVDNIADCRFGNSIYGNGNNRAAQRLRLGRHHAGHLRAAGDQRQRIT
jgi:hypothetical protein